MKTINEIHLDNLRALVDEFKSVTAVAALIGCSDSQYSQWLNASTNSGTGKPRGLRPVSTRRIEKACGKPTGWMDKEHPKLSVEAATIPQETMLYLWVSVEEAELVTNLRTSEPVGRGLIIETARGVKKAITPATAEHK